MGNKFSRRQPSKTVGSEFRPLTRHDKKIICSTWPILMRQNTDIWQQIWIKSMEKSPMIKASFDTLGNEDNEDIRLNHNFIRLTTMVEAFFHQLIITHRLDSRAIEEKCLQLGARHAGFAHQRGFQSVFWDIFNVCTLDVLSSTYMVKRNPEMLNAWSHFMEQVVNIMREGYQAAFGRSSSTMTETQMAIVKEETKKNSSISPKKIVTTTNG